MYTRKQFGSYRLLRLLGEGGFAQVYLGEHIHLKTRAAVKILTTTLSEDEMSQFRNEAHLMMEMDHPHIIRVLDFGLQGHVPFLVMSYAPSGTLRDRHPKGTPLSLPTVVEYVNQIASALQYIHNRKLIHRDVKPENMLITQSGVITLSDFGIAVRSHSERSLRQQDIGGTGIYMAPELFEGKPRTASDQYALAIVVYEWLTGAPPFQGSITQLAYRHAITHPRSLREHIPVSQALDVVILQALAKDPLARFSSVQEFALAFAKASDDGNTDVPDLQASAMALNDLPRMPVHYHQHALQRHVHRGLVSPSLMAEGQSRSRPKPTPPFSEEHSIYSFSPRYQFLAPFLSMPKTKKNRLLPMILIMSVFLLISGTVFGMEKALSSFFPHSKGVISGGSSTTVPTFLNDVMQQNYNQAYSHLDLSLALVMTEQDFAKQAQSDDRCYGPVVRYAEVANSERTQNEAQRVTYMLTREKLLHSYSLSFTLHKDIGSDNWLISQYGGQDDLGPTPPAC